MMTEAFNHLNKVKCRESQLACIPPWDSGEGNQGARATLRSSWRGLGPGEAAWVGVLGTIKSKLGTHGCN